MGFFYSIEMAAKHLGSAYFYFKLVPDSYGESQTMAKLLRLKKIAGLDYNINPGIYMITLSWGDGVVMILQMDRISYTPCLLFYLSDISGFRWLDLFIVNTAKTFIQIKFVCK